MKERPILFSGPMVRAILDGSKTQTRRVAKPVRRYEHNNICRPDLVEDPYAVWWHGVSENVGCFQICPYGTPGDRLWVRETWAAFTQPTHEYGESDLVEGPIAEAVETHGPLAYVYRADGNSLPDRWRPSIFMPRAASRILLEITDVRVQRLQEISDEDARAEGYDRSHAFPREWFALLWERIHGPGSWHVNPWVWAITFQRLGGSDV
jgi:hypothetical protein